MSLPEPDTQGHASSQGARVALSRHEDGHAIKHLAGGMWWTADQLVHLERRLIALEDWAQAQGYTLPSLPDPDTESPI